MNVLKLKLLEDNDAAQAMAIAWPEVGLTRGDGDISQELIRRWSKVAGIAPHEILTWETMLFTNGIITKDGKLDPVAEAFLKAAVISGLPKEVRERLHKEGRGGS